MPTPEAVSQLRESIRGEVIDATSSAYDEARKVHNGMIDKKPSFIVRCSDAADVMAAIKFAHAEGIQASIRGGGHNAAGLGICDNGLVIDLSPIKYVRVDPATGQVRVGGGNVWREVDHATHPFGLTVPTGIIGTTGVAGLTLGGGTGYLSRKYGLTIDNLLSADVVLADGSFVVASATENSDLFWALRGGGGNFGVVTSFLFQGQPVSTVIAGPMLWEIGQAAEILKFYRDFIAKAPPELNGFFAFLTVPPGPPFPEAIHMKKMCGIVWCHTGTQEQADKDLAPMRAFLKPAFEYVGPAPFPAINGMFDPLYPSGMQWYWKADLFNELSDAAIAVHAKFGPEMPTFHSSMHLYPIDATVHRTANSDTAWSYRDANFNGVIIGVDPDPANRDKIVEWTRAYYDALHPHGAGGAYVNFMMEEGDDRIRATYRGNYDRLAAVKAKYDPENFFRVNQNIRPAAQTAAS